MKTPAEALGHLLHHEIAVIGALGTALDREEDPGYTHLYRAVRAGHQSNAAQLAMLRRLAGHSPGGAGGGVREWLLKLETAVTQATAAHATLRALRSVERALLEAYDDATPRDDGTTRRALTTMRRRLERHAVVLGAHAAGWSDDAGDPGDPAGLPFPLGDYLAGPRPRVCQRCLLDRPGTSPPIERADPATYLCRACHHEIAAELAVALGELAARRSSADLEALVVARATARPAVKRAEEEVLSRLAGQAAAPPPARPRKEVLETRVVDPARARPGTTALALEHRGPLERAYVETLFDPPALRRSW